MKKRVVFLIVACVAILTFMQSLAYADWFDWIKYTDNPVLTGAPPSGSPCVLEINGEYHMWYIKGWGIWHSTSSDGKVWTEAPNNPALADGRQLALGTVFYTGTSYHMWYSWGGATGRIGYATSGDGNTWADYGLLIPPGPLGSYDEYVVGSPFVMYDGTADLYKMWYVADNYSPSGRKIAYATSPNPDGPWAKHGLVFEPAPGSWYSWSVGSPFVEKKLDVDEYIMWFTGGSGSSGTIGHVHSQDGINWDHNTVQLDLNTGLDGEWDDTTVGSPWVLSLNNNSRLLYYAAVDGPGNVNAIGLAQDGYDWSYDQISTQIMGKGIPVILVHGNKSEGENKARWETFEKYINDHYKDYAKFDIYIWKHNTAKAVGFNGNTGNAKDLSVFIDQLISVKSHYTNKTKFIFVAHSRGGLVCRSYMNYDYDGDGKLEGEKVYGLITLGTPHHGSPGAVPDWVAFNFFAFPGSWEWEYNQIFCKNEGCAFDPSRLGDLNLAWDNMDNVLLKSTDIINYPVDIAYNEKMWLSERDMNKNCDIAHDDYTNFYKDQWNSEDFKGLYGTLYDLNLKENYANKIIAFAAYDQLLISNYDITDMFGAWMKWEHDKLELATKLLADFSKSGVTKSDIVFYANDGLVPIQSALFLDTSGGDKFCKYEFDGWLDHVELDEEIINSRKQVKKHYIFNGKIKDHLDLLDTNEDEYWAAITSEINGFVDANGPNAMPWIPLLLLAHEAGTFTDIRDGRVYKTVKIGDQWWFAENLKYITSGSWAYDNNSNNAEIYGRLYNWATANTACPEGWHLPSDDEWQILEMYLGMSEEIANQTGWRGDNVGAELKEGGSSGVEVLFGGYYYPAVSKFGGKGSEATFWLSDYAGFSTWHRRLSNNETGVFRSKTYNSVTVNAFSVRPIKD